MALLQELFTANYNGIPFTVDVSVMRQGRKTATYEYPDVKYRFVQDLGENLRTFSLQGIVSGDDYIARREALIIALNIGGKGILTHPFYGIVTVVVKDYSITEDMTKLGECVFDMVFEESNDGIFPISNISNISAINEAVNDSIALLSGAIETGITTRFKQNITPAANKNINLSTNLTTNLSTVNDYDQNNLNSFNASNKTFTTNIYYLVEDPASLGDSLTSLLNSYNDLALTPLNQYLLNASNYYFGSDDVYPLYIQTLKLAEQKKNDAILNSVINAQLLLNLYSSATLITYQDTSQIQQINSDLEEKYIYLLNTTVLSRDIMLSIEKIRNQVNQFFNTLAVNISKVITVAINTPTNLSVLLYDFYENFDNENEILALNDIYDVGTIMGEIKLLSNTV